MEKYEMHMNDLLTSKLGKLGCYRNELVLERYGRNGGPVHREGCGVPQNGTPRDTGNLHR